MSGAPFLLASLDATHDRTAFRSDSEPLNRYLREQVTQDIRRRVAACFVALADGQRIAGKASRRPSFARSLTVLHFPFSEATPT